MEFTECLNENAKKKKKGHFLYIGGGGGVEPFKSLLVPTCLILSTIFMDSMMI